MANGSEKAKSGIAQAETSPEDKQVAKDDSIANSKKEFFEGNDGFANGDKYARLGDSGYISGRTKSGWFFAVLNDLSSKW